MTISACKSTFFSYSMFGSTPICLDQETPHSELIFCITVQFLKFHRYQWSTHTEYYYHYLQCKIFNTNASSTNNNQMSELLTKVLENLGEEKLFRDSKTIYFLQVYRESVSGALFLELMKGALEIDLVCVSGKRKLEWIAVCQHYAAPH